MTSVSMNIIKYPWHRVNKPEEYFLLKENMPKNIKMPSQEEIDSFVKGVKDNISQFNPVPANPIYPTVQRMLDIIVASFLTIPAILALGIIASISKISEPNSDLFFVQNRIGKNGKEFPIYKLQTIEETPKGWKYASRYAKFLRKYSLDEIPQIWNVFKGDMSFMGPRALLCIELMSDSRNVSQDFIAERCNVKPGFGFGYQSGRTLPKPRIEMEKDLFKDMGYRTYFKTLKNLAITIIKGNNK